MLVGARIVMGCMIKPGEKSMDYKTNKLRYHKNWDYYSAWLRRLIGVCEFCGNAKRSNNPLTVHHKDYNPANNHLDNLVVLCAACHLRHQAYEKVSPYVKEQICIFVV